MAGINVLFDPEYDTAQTIRSQQIDLTNAPLEQALDQVSVVTKSFWKPLSANTIFVTVDNPTKRREYSEQVVKVFYLSNVTAPQEMQEMLTVLRTVVDVQKVFNFTSQNALIVRADADTMALVEKLISDLDKPRPEVIIDVMVMEVNSAHMRNITAAFASTGINDERYFCAAPGDYNARHSDGHVDHLKHHDHHRDHGNHDNSDHHEYGNHQLGGNADQHERSAESAQPYIERGFLDYQPARGGARGGPERFREQRCCRRRKFAPSTIRKPASRSARKFRPQAAVSSPAWRAWASAPW